MAKSNLWIGVLFLAAAWATGQQRQDVNADNGTSLLRDCQSAVRALEETDVLTTAESAYCAGYVQGVTETLSFFGKTCFPRDVVGASQAARIVVKFLSDHPARLHEPQFRLVKEAMTEAFPCKTPK